MIYGMLLLTCGGRQLKQEVINSGATLIVRPDSGHPPSVVLRSAQLLEESFGFTINSKGYKVLNHVRIIQGDGINEHTIQEILDALLINGYSATNIAFGCGGQLLQAMDRDTLRFAMKCSHIVANRKSIDVFKDPITDHGKRSKAGRLDLINNNGKLETIRLTNDNDIQCPLSVMRTVYENGELLVDDSLENIRKRAVV
jgi:nicotinamide phosphoribosyltransferase